MADTIIRLKVESQEYEGKIKRAVQGLQQLEKHVRDMGASFEVAEKADLEFVRALGQMETKATSNIGKLAELKSAFVELSVQYKNLSDAEKKGEFGVALNRSLSQLKGRIDDLGSQIKEANTDINGMGSILESVAGKIGIPVELFTKMGVAVAAAGAAIKVATDAFKSNESLVDEWGRTVEAASSVYDGFLTSLNTGDFGGFLSRIGDIISAARNAYDELDRLGTMRTIQSPEMSAQRAENERNRAMLQTRRYIAPLDGSAGIAGMKTGDLLSDKQVKQIEADLQNGIKNISALIENEVQQTNNAIDAEYEKQASLLGMTVKEFREGTSSMAEFDKMIELSKKYYEFEAAHTRETMDISTGHIYTKRDNEVNPYEAYKNWDVFRVDSEAYNNLVKLIQQRDQQMSLAYSSQAQAYRSINRVEGITARGGAPKVEAPKVEVETAKIKTATDIWDQYTAKIDEAKRLLGEFQAMAANTELSEEQRNWAADMVKKYEEEIKKLKNTKEVIPIKFSDKGIKELKNKIKEALGGEIFGSDGYALQSTKIVDVTTLENLLNTALTNGLNVDMTYLSGLFESIKLDADIDDSTWETLVAEINTQLENLDLPKIKLDVNTGNITNVAKEASKATDEWQQSISAVGQLGGALQGLEDPSAKVAGIIAQAIANIVLTFTASLKGSVTAWDWIAAAISGTATMISTIASIKSVTSGSYADGGIIPGNNYSGDMLTANVNAGELILNRAQQSSIASQLASSNPMGGMQLEALISGESLRLVLANNASRRGGNRGQYAITKFG